MDSVAKAQSSIQSLEQLLGPVPPSISSADSLLKDPEIAEAITSRLRQPNSGVGEDNLCRWLYDTFQSSDPKLQLAVLRFLPTIAGVYLTRAISRKNLAGFEAVLLALYAHETQVRAGQPLSVTIPDISRPSLYHEPTRTAAKGGPSSELNVAIYSPALEPHGTVRSTKRALIVGVALELYYRKISQMPTDSKMDFCEFFVIWAGQDGDMFKDEEYGEGSSELSGTQYRVSESNSGVDDCRSSEDASKKSVKGEGRIPLPWELLQPSIRILGHCLLGPTNPMELKEAAAAGIRSLYARALHDVNPRAILATGSLLRLGKMEMDKIKNSSGSSTPTGFEGSEIIVITT